MSLLKKQETFKQEFLLFRVDLAKHQSLVCLAAGIRLSIFVYLKSFVYLW